jgi:hypothetical protein
MGTATPTAPGEREADPPARRPPVPYVTRWSGEQDGPMPVVLRRDRKGIRYADERRYDRDPYGVLWERTPSQPGGGTPQFGKVHGLRQRLAMAGLRCQICGGPADRNQDGVLWIIDARPSDLLPEGESTGHPPVCRPCAHQSIRACPHLRTRQVILRVRTFTPSGVLGTLYRPTPTGPRACDAATLRLADALIPWLRGSQLVVDLADYTSIDLNDPTA